MLTAALERQTRTGDEVFDGIGDEDFPGTSECGNASADVHSDAAKLLADDLALSGMKARPHVDTDETRPIADGLRAAHGARRPIECGEEPITRRVELAAAESGQLTTRDSVVGTEHVTPLAVTERGGSLGRTDDVREQHGGQDAVDVDGAPRARQKLLESVQHGVGVAHPGNVVHAGKHRQSRIRNVFGEITRLLDAHDAVARPVQDEGRHAHGREYVADVDLLVHFHHGHGRAGTGGQPAVGRRPLQVARVVGGARRPQISIDSAGLGPPAFDPFNDCAELPLAATGAGIGPIQHQGGCSGRKGRGEEQRHRSAF